MSIWFYMNIYIIYIYIYTHIYIYIYIYIHISGWWFGTFFIFPYFGYVIILIDFHIFQRGLVNHQPDIYIYISMQRSARSRAKVWGRRSKSRGEALPSMFIWGSSDFGSVPYLCLPYSIGIPCFPTHPRHGKVFFLLNFHEFRGNSMSTLDGFLSPLFITNG